MAGSGWVRPPTDGQFASLRGETTLPAWPDRGIDRALLRRRTLLAAQTRHHRLQIDCSPASHPTLERVEVAALNTTASATSALPGRAREPPARADLE